MLISLAKYHTHDDDTFSGICFAELNCGNEAMVFWIFGFQACIFIPTIAIVTFILV